MKYIILLTLGERKKFMMKLMYVGEKSKYDISFKKINQHILQITGDFPVKTKGFILSRDGHNDNWDYSRFKTVYQEIEGGAQFSDDSSVYTAPVTPEPVEPEPYIPTLDEIKAEKIATMKTIQQGVIQSGINVTMADGSVEHFTLTANDQTSLMGLQTQVATGEEKIPWHTSNQAEHCKYYSNADMALIVTNAMQYVSYHVTYYRDLRIYINSLTDAEAVNAVTYGMPIPKEYQSEPLKDMYATMGGS